MAIVYILYSKSVDHYYIGYTTESIEIRIEKHLNNFYKNKYTKQAKDWELYFHIICQTDYQARNIEKHIKKMKSRKYITDLTQYPEIAISLLKKYA